MTDKELKRIFEVYYPPFKYEKGAQVILDSHNHMVLDIRGWGYLQRFNDGVEIQDNVGQLVVDLLNDKHNEYKNGRKI